jgi:hypothetical protein
MISNVLMPIPILDSMYFLSFSKKERTPKNREKIEINMLQKQTAATFSCACPAVIVALETPRIPKTSAPKASPNDRKLFLA